MINKTFILKSLFLAVCLVVFANPSFVQAGKFKYKKVLKEWTRKQEVYQREDFHASLSWKATWLEPSFIKALSKEHTKIYNLSSQEEAEFYHKIKNQYSPYEVFFVSFYAYNAKDADLSKSKPIWQLALHHNNKKIKPFKIEKISKPNTYLKHLFPYINVWSHHYYVYFPKQSETSQQTILKVAGPDGRGKLEWHK